MSLSGKTIVLGIGGGIAAYKAAELVRLLVKAGATVRVVMTAAAQQFITPLTLQTLSNHPVATELFDLTQESEIGHIALADAADLLLVAPATADLIARLALGLAGDLLTTVALACPAPLLLAPAMNVNMWAHPQVREHVEKLTSRGARIVGPDPGELACGWIGPGRLVDPAQIVAAAAELLATSPRPHVQRGGAGPVQAPAQAPIQAPAQDLAGTRVLVTAGPTYEAIDPVRFIGNRSSGKMGFAIAAAAASRGAQVTLVAGPVSLPTPPGVRRIDVESAAQMAAAVLPVLEPVDGAPAGADVVVMTAAVADFRPAEPAAQKLKKAALGERPVVTLEPTVDILRELGARRRGTQPLLVGFAAETREVESYAARKLREKRCDLVVANDVSEPGSGFGTDTNRVTLLWNGQISDAEPVSVPVPVVDRLPQLSKDAVAARILDRVVALLRPA